MQVLLLDEVTVDLDVVARMDLLEFFREESDKVLPNLLLLTFFCFWVSPAKRSTFKVCQKVEAFQ